MKLKKILFIVYSIFIFYFLAGFFLIYYSQKSIIYTHTKNAITDVIYSADFVFSKRAVLSSSVMKSYLDYRSIISPYIESVSMSKNNIIISSSDRTLINTSPNKNLIRFSNFNSDNILYNVYFTHILKYYEGIDATDVDILISLDNEYISNTLRKLVFISFVEFIILPSLLLLLMIFLAMKFIVKPIDEIIKYINNRNIILPKYFCTDIDILKNTIEKNFEEIESINSELEIRIENQVKDIQLKDKIVFEQSKYTAIGEVISSIAHQWRQPLNNISLIIQDFKDAYYYGELDEEYINKKVYKSKEIVSYMSSIIDNFRNLFKINKQKTKFDVSKKVYEVISVFEPTFNEIGIEIRYNIPNESFEIYGYPNEYMQVIVNILINSKDILKERKIINPFIMISCQVVDKQSILTVEDNGTGVDENIIDKIFDPYFTTKHQSQGTGMGLYIARTTIEAMGGNIVFHNSDIGAVFTIVV
jgi:signal transduction histidine kinase